MIIVMTKEDQVRIVAEHAGITATQARAALDAVVGVITAGLIAESRLVVHGLGTFEVVMRRPHRVVHPATGKSMQIPAKASVKFRPVAYVRDRVQEAHSA